MNMRMNFRIVTGSETKAMLRRTLSLLLVAALVAGPVFAAHAASAAAGCDQMSVQDDGGSGNCGDDGMAADACVTHCTAGACVVPSISTLQLTVPTARVSSHERVLTGGDRCAPETAPPKASVS